MRFAQSTRGSRFLAALAASGVAACAAMDGEVTAARESWRGATYDQVVAVWGPPARSAKNSHAWSPRRRHDLGGGPHGVAARCERTLVIQDARVVGEGEWSGAPEFCERFARPPP